MKLIACDPVMGLPRLPLEGLNPDKADLLAEMKRLKIDAALVRHQTARDAGPVAGNLAIMEDIGDATSLLGTWFVTPDGLEPDFDLARVLDDMQAAGVGVAWTESQEQQFSLLPWCSGELYEALAARQIPLLLEPEKLQYDDLHIVLSDFPRLRVILTPSTRVIGRHRMLYPLLRRHENLMVCLNQAYCVHRGIEDLCHQFGSHRWVFGMGYPQSEGGAAVTGLMYAEITDEQRFDIGYRNIERLLSEVIK